MTSASRPFDDFLCRVSAQLRGPLWWRRRVLRELSDGLSCAAADQPVDLGVERQILAEWGPADALVTQFNEVGLRRWARRMALRLLIAVPLLVLGWGSVVLFSPVRFPWPVEPLLTRIGTHVLAVTVPLTLVSAFAAVRSLRRLDGLRSSRPPVHAVAACAVGVTISSIAVLVMLCYRAGAGRGAVLWPLVVAPAVLSFILLVTTVLDALRFLHARIALESADR
jgi:hypothetical protein